MLLEMMAMTAANAARYASACGIGGSTCHDVTTQNLMKQPPKTKPPIEFKNLGKDPAGYFVGYLKGKRKKYVEQKERYATPEEAMNALIKVPLNTQHKFLGKKGEITIKLSKKSLNRKPNGRPAYAKTI